MKSKIGKDGIPILEQPVERRPLIDSNNRSKKIGSIHIQQVNNIIQRINNNIEKKLEALVQTLKNNIADDLKKAFEELQKSKEKK